MAHQDAQLLERRVGLRRLVRLLGKGRSGEKGDHYQADECFHGMFLRYKIAESDEWIRSKVRVNRTSGGHIVLSLGWRGHSTELLHHAERVVFLPLLSDLSPDDAIDHHTAGCHQLACGSDSHQISPMDASETPTGYHLVAFGYLVLNRPLAIGEGGKHLGQELTISLAPELPDCRCVVYAVRKQLLNEGHIVLREKFLDYASS